MASKLVGRGKNASPFRFGPSDVHDRRARLTFNMGLVIRTIGLARAEATVTLVNMAYNMKRWCWLDRRGLPA